MKTIIISVTNDLIADYRVHRTASTLQQKLNCNVVLIGRNLRNSPSLNPRSYKTFRFNLPIEKGPLFYALYNFVLFFYLLFHKVDILLSNDLDTLPANYFISKIKRKKLIFDSHELFTEVPELVNRPKVRKIWSWIEKTMAPSADASYTVCKSIADYFNKSYNMKMVVVRNVSERNKNNETIILPEIGNGKKIIIYQGVVNIGRGLEKTIMAMRYIENTILLILGDGDVMNEIKTLVKSEQLEEKVMLLGRKSFAELHQYTRAAHIGISLEENMGLNYYYALPNKIFAYIQAGVPLLVSDFPEMGSLVKSYNIGKATLENDPKKLAELINSMLSDEVQLSQWKINLQKAANELCWENEEKILINLFQSLHLSSYS